MKDCLKSSRMFLDVTNYVNTNNLCAGMEIPLKGSGFLICGPIMSREHLSKNGIARGWIDWPNKCINCYLVS